MGSAVRGATSGAAGSGSSAQDGDRAVQPQPGAPGEHTWPAAAQLLLGSSVGSSWSELLMEQSRSHHTQMEPQSSRFPTHHAQNCSLEGFLKSSSKLIPTSL